MWSLVLLLRCAVLGRSGLLALLLPVAELVLIVPGLDRVSFLYWRCRLGLRMRPALRPIIVVLIYSALRRTRSHLPFRTHRLGHPRGHCRLLRSGVWPRHLWAGSQAVVDAPGDDLCPDCEAQVCLFAGAAHSAAQFEC